MLSAFNKQRRKIRATSKNVIEETYNLRGNNFSIPDEIMPVGESPWTINSRMYARNDGESRVAMRTRMGAGRLSEAVGFAANVYNTGSATGDLDFSTTKVIANPIVFSSAGNLVQLDTELKKIGVATGHILVEFYTNNGGIPGDLIGESSVLGSAVTTSYQFLPSYFIDAPAVNSTDTYWAVYYIQDNGSGSYYLNKTVAGSILELSSLDGGMAWTTIDCGIRHKTYLGTAGGVLGYNVRYPSSASNNAIILAQNTSVFSVAKATGVITAIDTGLNANADKYRFEQSADYTLYANGYNHLRRWNGTTAEDVANVPTANPENVLAWQNRIFIYKNTRVEFSELGDMTVWPSDNYFYIPITTPLSADHITGWKVFQDNLIFWTHLTKYQVIGSNISNFTYKEVIGTKGAASQEGITIDRNYAYFISDDKQIYRWNGISDELLSMKVEPELQGIQDVKQVRLELYRNQLRVYYAKTPDTANNRMLLLDIENSAKDDFQWFLDTEHSIVGSAHLFLDQDDPLIEFSSLVGQVYYGESQTSDVGKALDFKWWTNYKIYSGGASTKKRVKSFRPIVRTGNADYTLSVGKDMDFQNDPDMRAYVVAGGGAKFGAFIWGDGTKWGHSKQIMTQSGMSGRGNFIQYRFERKGVDTPVELYGYISQLKIGKAK